MQNLLYLVHRIPYPPNKGDKIRSYHLLKYLSEKYHVHVGAFVDDPDDFQYKDKLNAVCASSCLCALDSQKAKLRSLSGFLSGKALTLPYYFDVRMQAWVDDIIREHDIRKAVVFSSSMAQYLCSDKYKSIHRLIDFVDVDSDKWSQYVDSAGALMKPVYKYEAKKLFAWEVEVARLFKHAFFVSRNEADMFKRLAPDVAGKVSFYNNGVDTAYFSSQHRFDSPYPQTGKVLVFTGAMDYWANVDAVVWFAEQVLPELQAVDSEITFYIVGAKPTEKVRALASLAGVTVTGAVDDIRPYMAHADLAVAPMRIARGIQNKVLEAMAMGRPVVASPQGYEGIDAEIGRELNVAADKHQWVAEIGRLLGDPEQCDEMGEAARARVIKDYSWDGSLSRLGGFL